MHFSFHFSNHFLEENEFIDSVAKVPRRNRANKSKFDDNPNSMKAIKYVTQLRQLEREQQAQQHLPRLDKELEIQHIGQSWQSRLASVTVQRPPASRTAKKPRDNDDDGDGETPSYNPNLQVQSKYLPPDLTKMSSVQVIDILKQSVIFDKSDILIISKPVGLEMFAPRGHSIEKYLPQLADFSKCSTLYQVHRLDKMTSGALILAKTQNQHDYLTKMFKQRLIKKSYWTIVNGTPEPSEGVINIPLCETQLGDRYRMTVLGKSPKKIKMTSTLFPAVTEYQTLKVKGNAALLEMTPITGYKHQIRAHLGLGLGCPVLGDHKFSSISFDGKPQKIHGDILKRLQVRESKSRNLPMLLHAKRIQMPLEDGKLVKIECSLPHHFVRIMKALKVQPL